MAKQEIEKVRKILASLPDTENMEWSQIRAYMDMIGEKTSLLPGVNVREHKANNVSGLWISPENADPDAAILYFHGGGYTTGSSMSHRYIACAIASAANAPLFIPDYSLGPENPFPAAVNDAVACYDWFMQNNQAPERFALMGDSAGGGLALAALVSQRDNGVPMPAAGILISPWTDLSCSADSYKTRADMDPIVALSNIGRYADAYLGSSDPKNPLASPLFADLTDLPPLLIQVGENEVLHDDSVDLTQRARKKGVKVELEVWEDMIHVWHSFFPILSQGRQAIKRIGEFFQNTISGELS